VANFELLADRLKRTPLTLTGYPDKYTYAQLVDDTSGALKLARGYATLDVNLSGLMILTEPPGPRRATPAERSKAMSALVARVEQAAAGGNGLSIEAFMAVS